MMVLLGGMPMNRSRVFSISCLLLFLPLLPASAGQTPGPGQAPAVHEIQMTARKYKFDPDVITVKKGEVVRLIITALDRRHGFKLQEFGIDQVLLKGAPTTVEFTADKVGTFEFKCSVFCGFGHGKMKGKLVVEE
jgi:cytochrome c oxidase subunit 2